MTPLRLPCFSLVAALVIVGSGVAVADPLSEARRLSANPDTPVMSLNWRVHLHGSVGAEIPILVEDETGGFGLRVPAMIEVYNTVNNVLPNNYWRGLLGLEFGYRVSSVAQRLPGSALTLEVHHESDHQTLQLIQDFGRLVPDNRTPAGFFDLNSVGLRLDVPRTLARQQWVFSGTGRLHIISCNLNPIVCGSGLQGYGSETFEGLLQAVWTGPATPSRRSHWRPTASVFANWLVPNGLIHDERRLVLNAGGWVRTERRGMLQVYALAWFGNTVGYFRDQRVAQVGAGFRWTP